MAVTTMCLHLSKLTKLNMPLLDVNHTLMRLAKTSLWQSDISSLLGFRISIPKHFKSRWTSSGFVFILMNEVIRFLISFLFAPWVAQKPVSWLGSMRKILFSVLMFWTRQQGRVERLQPCLYSLLWNFSYILAAVIIICILYAKFSENEEGFVP